MYTRSIRPRPGMLCCFILFFSMAAAMTAGAAVRSPDQTNWTYQIGTDPGITTGVQENVNVYKIPFSYTFEDFNKRQNWDLKVTFPLSIGLYNIESGEQSADVNFLAILPGAELHIPVRENWVLIPMAGFGFGKTTSGDSVQYLYSVGIKHHLMLKWRQFDLTYGNTLRSDGYFSGDGSGSDNTPVFTTGLDMKFPLGIRLFQNPGYLSVYGMNLYYADGIEVDVDRSILNVKIQWELGLTISTEPNMKLWWFPIERIGMGYRFGDGFSAIRLVFGMPF